MEERIYDVLNWDETFMSIATVVKFRSKDPVTQVGACIVSDSQRILSMGYNGAPNGFEDTIFPWGKTDEYLNTKYPYVVHAERNAILNFRGSLSEFNNSTLYVTHFPCNECAKEIVQVGISRIVYSHNPDLEKDHMKASLRILDTVGIKYEKYNGIEMLHISMI